MPQLRIVSEDMGYDGPDGPVDVSDDTIRMADEIKRRYLQRDVVLQRPFYNRLQGRFRFRNIGRGRGQLDIDLPTPQDEYIFAHMLVHGTRGVQVNLLGGLARFADYHNIYFNSIFMQYLLDNGQFSDHFTQNRVLNTRTGRNILVNNRTYRNIYGTIRMLRDQLVRLITHFNSINYDIEGNCCVSYFRKKRGITLTDAELMKLLKCKDLSKGLTYPQVMKLCKHNNIPCEIRTVTDKLIAKQEGDGNKVNIVIHDEHMYVVRKFDITHSTKKYYIKSIEELEKIKGTYKTIMTDDLDLFNEIKDNNKDITQLAYDDDKTHYNTHLIIYNDNAKLATVICQLTNKHSFYNYIESVFKLKGNLTDYAQEIFNELSPIRNSTYDVFTKNTHQFDHNGSYASHLLKVNKNGLQLPIPTIADKWEKYDGTEIIEYYFYHIENAKTDKILNTTKEGIYSGHTLKYMTHRKLAYEIKHMFKVSDHQTITKDFLDEPKKELAHLLHHNGNTEECKCTKDDIKGFVETHAETINGVFNKYTIRRYIGWLQKKTSIVSKKYDNIKGEEAKALKALHGPEFFIRGTTGTYITDNIRVKTGQLSAIVIKELTNIALHKFNRYITKMNKGVILNSIKTDSLGYIYNGETQLKTPKLKKDLGYFKDEGKKIKAPHQRSEIHTNKENVIECPPLAPQIEEHKINHYKKTDIVEKLLKLQKSFALLGGPGYGKSFNIQNRIIKYLKENGKRYVLAGATIEASVLLKCNTIHEELKGSKNELINKFSRKAYIIIDEASQLTQGIFQKLMYIKTNTNCNIILVGDEFQCKSVDAKQISYLECDYVHKLVDYNKVVLEWHERARYTKRMDKALKQIKTHIIDGDTHALKKVITDTFKFVKAEDNPNLLNFAFLHKTCNKYINGTKTDKKGVKFAELIEGKGTEKVCYTTHWVQGKTINVNYTIHDFGWMLKDPRVLYTAISRATDISQILFCK